jgi:hypothetical protein
MMTFTCKTNGCVQKDVDYDFIGTPNFVECGNCGSKIQGENERPDPVFPDEFTSEITEA